MKKTLISMAIASTFAFAAPVMASNAYKGANVSYTGHGHGATHNLRPYQDNVRPSTFSINFVEVGYAATSYDGDIIDDNSDGFYFQGRKSLNEQVYLHGFYTDQDMDDADISGYSFNVGLGTHKTIHYNYGYEVVGFLQAGYGKLSGVSDVPFFSGKASTDGPIFNIGASSNLGMQGVELAFSVDHYRFDDSETGVSVSGAFPINKEISIAGKYTNIDSNDLYFVGLRYAF